jgi:hypothetical protein
MIDNPELPNAYLDKFPAAHAANGSGDFVAQAHKYATTLRNGQARLIWHSLPICDRPLVDKDQAELVSSLKH